MTYYNVTQTPDCAGRVVLFCAQKTNVDSRLTVATEFTVVEAALLFCCVPDAEAAEFCASLVTVAAVVCNKCRVSVIAAVLQMLPVMDNASTSATVVRPKLVGMSTSVT